VSQANVELVRRLQPPPDTDFVAVFRDEGDTGPLADWFAAFFHPDGEFVVHGLSPINATGLSDFRDAWRDWLAPWVSYRTSTISSTSGIELSSSSTTTGDAPRRRRRWT
jgi:hypothetical protein